MRACVCVVCKERDNEVERGDHSDLVRDLRPCEEIVVEMRITEQCKLWIYVKLLIYVRKAIFHL